jgi:hypothetical protein
MDLAMEIDGHLNSDFCKEIITKFENDNRKFIGRAGGVVNPEIKVSEDLKIDRFVEWNDASEKLELQIKDGISQYKDYLGAMMPIHFLDFGKLYHKGFQIQKSGKYDWHDDSVIEGPDERVLTFIWYLNTKEEGDTDFHYKRVKPIEGKLVIFPSTWTYIHRGITTENKYIITGWFYRQH